MLFFSAIESCLLSSKKTERAHILMAKKVLQKFFEWLKSETGSVAPNLRFWFYELWFGASEYCRLLFYFIDLLFYFIDLSIGKYIHAKYMSQITVILIGWISSSIISNSMALSRNVFHIFNMLAFWIHKKETMEKIDFVQIDRKFFLTFCSHIASVWFFFSSSSHLKDTQVSESIVYVRICIYIIIYIFLCRSVNANMNEPVNEEQK